MGIEWICVVGKIADGRALKKGEKQKEGVRLEKSLHDGMVSFSVWRRRAYETGAAHKEGCRTEC